jgi:hypothetical protein
MGGQVLGGVGLVRRPAQAGDIATGGGKAALEGWSHAGRGVVFK